MHELAPPSQAEGSWFASAASPLSDAAISVQLMSALDELLDAAEDEVWSCLDRGAY